MGQCGYRARQRVNINVLLLCSFQYVLAPQSDQNMKETNGMQRGLMDEGQTYMRNAMRLND